MQRVISAIKKWWPDFNSTVGFFLLSVFLVWLKTYWAYKTKFSLGVSGSLQEFLLFLNPIPTAIILLGIALYFRGRIAYWLMLLINLVQTIWLFANILYYREFSDFLSLNIMNSGGSVENNLSKSIAGIIQGSDFLVFLDIIVLIVLLLTKVIKVDKTAVQKRFAALTTVFGILLMLVGYGISSKDRSGLLTRTFDNNYIVKYLGLNEYAAYNVFKTKQTADVKKEAKASDLDKIKQFVKNNSTLQNSVYFGKEKGKNVIMFHLESFQQFLIDYKVNGVEVTPNLNKFYHDQNTLAFDNFYNEVGQGKTADAEMMLETGLFGTASGSAMVNYGTSNTYQAVPAWLDQQGYTTAAFHGDVASFWNRDNTYKSWGYDYFFSKPYYKDADNASYNIGYGMKDKIFLQDAAKYVEQLPQPFYAKLITVTNHYPYDLDKQNISIEKTTTGDKTVDGYVQTARYLDQSFAEFLNWMKKSGLYDKSMIVLYGDHYGISENHPAAIAKLMGKSSVNKYDLANWQKVPFIVHAPGLQGGVNHTYGGEIDVMPTLLHLLGVSTANDVQFGQDLLATNRKQVVPFRNGDWVSAEYMKYGGNYYVTTTGTKINPKEDPRAKEIIDQTQAYVNKMLTYSDNVQTGDLLRFYTPEGFKKVKKSDYSYKKSDGLKLLKQMDKKQDTTLKDQHDQKSTMADYVTDAPELGGQPQTIQQVSSSSSTSTDGAATDSATVDDSGAATDSTAVGQ
ncbi:LTA synthase family protein [Weissella cibaria]|uniref:LTA synthase family protein n=1 Tax=Weissella cibaria TaxID=137591 RepID=UPI001E45C82C|nr:LTA synthase family protein [Weissella cibaria]MCC6122441.1 LTA synthase family protein [Weissella cibaria]MCT0952003.1 LTA synthase family protein [Weissella cibaria]